jgi:hypothetical protein
MPVSPTPFEISFLLLASVHSLAFYIVVDKCSLLSTWLAAALGIGLGQLVAERFSWHGLFMFGSVYLLETAFAAWLAMAVAKRAIK